MVFRNAGVLFFAREPRRFFNQAYITCLLFKGTSKVHILDRKDFDGGVVADIEDSLRFIERNTRTAYRIERLQREEIPEYPMAPLREAITNAVMHRDWFIEGANVFIEIYEDRIEVSSPGGLPKGMLFADLGHKSVRRNPLIADLLHRIAFIEKAGTGIKRMREGARAQGYPEPEFSANSFFTALFRPLAQATPQITYPSGTKLGPSWDQDEILRACLSDSGIKELMANIGRTNRTKFRDQVLNPLIEAKLIEMTIPDKPRSPKQQYRTTPAGRAVLKKREKEPQA
ncbi:MAG: ATP-binding protein [bacterium]